MQNVHRVDKDVAEDRLPATPRLRVGINRSTPFVITESWQSIPYLDPAMTNNPNAPYDINTFPHTAWDATNKKLMPNTSISNDQQYKVELDFLFSHTKRPVTFQFRFYVAAPTPITYPLPQSQQYITLKKVQKVWTGGLLGNLLALANLSLAEDSSTMTDDVLYGRTLYSSLNSKQYGVQPQIRTLQTFASADRPKLTDAVLTMYPSSI